MEGDSGWGVRLAKPHVYEEGKEKELTICGTLWVTA